MYIELKNQQPDYEECFWAFSKIQFEEGIEKKSIPKDQITNGGAGLYGTQKGIDNLKKFYLAIHERIRNECTPQEIYDYEFYNHECNYTGSDKEAIEIVKEYFGSHKVALLKRK